MKLKQAKQLIENNYKYLVSFDWIKGSMLESDHFPAPREGEKGLEENEAIKLGIKFANATKGKTCNFYLIRSDNFAPTGTWKLKNR